MNKSRTRVHFRGHSLKVDTVLLNGVISAENRNRKKKNCAPLVSFLAAGLPLLASVILHSPQSQPFDPFGLFVWLLS